MKSQQRHFVFCGFWLCLTLQNYTISPCLSPKQLEGVRFGSAIMMLFARLVFWHKRNFSIVSEVSFSKIRLMIILQDIVSGSCQSPAEKPCKEHCRKTCSKTFTCPNHSVAHQCIHVEKKPASILIAPNAFQANPLSTITSTINSNCTPEPVETTTETTSKNYRGFSHEDSQDKAI